MQTFLPDQDFEKSAKVLDNKRLNKQIVEAMQIMSATLDPYVKNGQNHPACKMWKGHALTLATYGLAMCNEYTIRAEYKKHHSYDPIFKMLALSFGSLGIESEKPEWLGDERIHATHRAALLAKDFEHYSQFGWHEEPMDLTQKPLPYYWPVE